MQLIKRREIQSKQRIVDFLNSEPVGRISTIDVDGYPQIIPMNFVYVRGIDTRVQFTSNNKNRCSLYAFSSSR